MNTEVKYQFKNYDYGVLSEISEISDGYVVVVRDIFSNDIVGPSYSFQDETDAMVKAMSALSDSSCWDLNLRPERGQPY